MKNEPVQGNLLPNPVYAIVAGGLRSIAASVPVCASLGQAWSEYDNRRTTERIEELLTNMRSELEALQQTMAARMDGVKDCRDFPELLEMTIEAVRKEFDEAKRVQYARILARVVADGTERSHDEKVAMIDSLDTLTEADLCALRLFTRKHTASVKELNWRELGLPGDVNDQLWQLACSLARLESRGLILKVSTHGGVVYVPRDFDNDTARWQESGYRLLPLGAALITVLFD